MIGRLFAMLALAGVALGAAALPASAHSLNDSDLVLAARCDQATGTFTIAATLTNSEQGNDAFTIDSNTKGLAFGTNPVPQGGSSTASDSGEPAGVLYTLTVSGHFGAQENDSATASITPEGECAVPVVVPPPSEAPPATVVKAPPAFTG